MKLLNDSSQPDVSVSFLSLVSRRCHLTFIYFLLTELSVGSESGDDTVIPLKSGLQSPLMRLRCFSAPCGRRCLRATNRQCFCGPKHDLYMVLQQHIALS